MKWKTLLAQNEALGGSSPSPGTHTFFTYCAFSTKHLARKSKHGERPDVPDLMRVSQHPMVSQRFVCDMPPHGQSVPPPMVVGSNPALDLKRQGSSVVEHWTFNPEEEVGRFSKNAHPLKAMMDPPVHCAALGRSRQPALVLRSLLCSATAPWSHHLNASGSQALTGLGRRCTTVSGTVVARAPHRAPRPALVVTSASLSHNTEGDPG